MFTKQSDLSELLQSGEWKHVGSGELQVYYDSDIYGSRISVINPDGLMLSNTVIGINTEMTVGFQFIIFSPGFILYSSI